MSDIASLLREAATYVGPCGDTELVEKLLAAAESLGEPVAWRAVGPSYTVVVTDPERATDSRWEPLYLAPQPAVPEGWELVPVEPTDEMIDAGCKQHTCEQQDYWYSDEELRDSDCIDIYKAMLAAAGGSHHE